VESNHSGQCAKNLTINLNRQGLITLHSNPFRSLNGHISIIPDTFIWVLLDALARRLELPFK
jgi:hypothetical protein